MRWPIYRWLSARLQNLVIIEYEKVLQQLHFGQHFDDIISSKTEVYEWNTRMPNPTYLSLYHYTDHILNIAIGNINTLHLICLVTRSWYVSELVRIRIPIHMTHSVDTRRDSVNMQNDLVVKCKSFDVSQNWVLIIDIYRKLRFNISAIAVFI